MKRLELIVTLLSALSACGKENDNYSDEPAECAPCDEILPNYCLKYWEPRDAGPTLFNYLDVDGGFIRECHLVFIPNDR